MCDRIDILFESSLGILEDPYLGFSSSCFFSISPSLSDLSGPLESDTCDKKSDRKYFKLRPYRLLLSKKEKERVCVVRMGEKCVCEEGEREGVRKCACVCVCVKREREKKESE